MKGFTKGKGVGKKFIPTSRKKQGLKKSDVSKYEYTKPNPMNFGLPLKIRKEETLDSSEDADRLENYMNEDNAVLWKTKEIEEMTSTKQALLDFKSSGERMIDQYDIENYNIGEFEDYDSGHYTYQYSVDRIVESIDAEVEKLQEEVDWTEKYYKNLIDHGASFDSPLSIEIEELSKQFYEHEVDQSLITDEFNHVVDPSREANKEYYEKMDDYDIDDEIQKIRDYLRTDLNRKIYKLNAKWFTYDQNQYQHDKSKRKYAIKKLAELEETQNQYKNVYQKELNLYDYLLKLRKRNDER